jgi:hypothetical protein
MNASRPSAPGGAPAIQQAKIAVPEATAAFNNTASCGKSASIRW